MPITRSTLGRLFGGAAIAAAVAVGSFGSGSSAGGSPAAGPASEAVVPSAAQGEVRAVSATVRPVTTATHPGSSRPLPDGGMTLDAVAPPLVYADGKGRVSIPALGIDRKVVPFECTSSAYPGDRIYRWGCGGDNNLYLFGHAHSIFKPLHDAYVGGLLEKGMTVVYTDAAGTVGTYEVIWWRVTTPDKGEFAYADQSTPSMTLQTCVGDDSELRLIVRLALVD